jgi:hypothetical protein
MRRILSGVLGCLLAGLVTAEPPEYAKRAKELEARAKKEPLAAAKFQREACGLWRLAYADSPQYEYLLSLSVCKRSEGDLAGAEGDLRAFLVQAPPEHPLRATILAAAEELASQRAQATAREPKLVVESPIPVVLATDKPLLSRRAWWIGGSVVGGLVVSVVTTGLFLSREGVGTDVDRVTVGSR